MDTSAETASRLRRGGAACLFGGILGAAQAGFMLVVPASVGDNWYSYPFGPTGYTIAQISFFAQHVLWIAGLGGLLLLEPIRTSRPGRVAMAAATLGMALLAVMELVAISAADVAQGTALGDLVDNLYTVPMLLIGVGLVVGGGVLVRRRSTDWIGPVWVCWVPLLLGVYVFVPLTPAIMGSFVMARIAIGGWMLIFAMLGLGLIRIAQPVRGGEHPRPMPSEPILG